jgi:hypothetical protein
MTMMRMTLCVLKLSGLHSSGRELVYTVRGIRRGKLMKRWVVVLLFAGVPAALLVVFLFTGADLVGGPDMLVLTETPTLDLMNSAVDQVVTMLSSIVLGLFVLLGFALQRHSGGLKWRISTLLAGLGFVASAFTSLYFGYAARMQSLEFLSAGHVAYDPVMQTVGRQAFFAAISSAVGISCLAYLLSTASGPPEVNGEKE